MLVRKIGDGSTITTLTTDDNGFISLQTDGHYEPFYLHLRGVPGGDKFWRSDESHPVGVWSPKELPAILTVLGDGVVSGYANEFSTSLVSGGPSVSVRGGAAVVRGHPVVIYSDTATFSISRPTTSTRVDRVTLRLHPEGLSALAGKAELRILQGTEGAGAPALTQNTTTYEISLYTITIPKTGTITLTDERAYAQGAKPTTGEARSDSAITTSTTGALLSGTTLTLTLPQAVTYDVSARLQCVQTDVSAGWFLAGTYLVGFAGISVISPPATPVPAQVAVNSAGKIYVADTANNRLVRLNSDGTYDTSITGLTGITGVCVDSSNNVYVAYRSGVNGILAKYNANLVLQDTEPLITAFYVHLATDNTYVYTTLSTFLIRKYTCSTLDLVTAWGGPGTSNGLFNTPWGIAYYLNQILVVDSGNSRVQVFNTSGTYVSKFTVPAGCRGVAVASDATAWVGAHSTNQLRNYNSAGTLLDTITQTAPDGITISTGDVLWVSNTDAPNVAKWDETAGGYGQVAINIAGATSTYVGPGNRISSIGNVATATATGPGSLTIQGFGKATSGQLTLGSILLTATAWPRG